MGEQENSVPTIRSSKKRPFASTATANQSQLPAGTKKRVPLGDLTNSPDVDGLSHNSDFESTQKPKSKSTKTKKKKVQESDGPEIVASFDDPQKRADTPLIYQHLHSLERKKGDPCPITWKRFKMILIKLCEIFYWIGWLRLRRNTNLSRTPFISLYPTLIDSYLIML
ncbi:hypothetical protein CsSME_00009704 [Camellia sinensis var. sinensis]